MLKESNNVDLPHRDVGKYINRHNVRISDVRRNLRDANGQPINSFRFPKMLKAGLSTHDTKIVKGVVDELCRQREQRNEKSNK